MGASASDAAMTTSRRAVLSCSPFRMSSTPVVSSFPDPFERLAADCGLRLTAEVLYAAPRDVLHPPADSDRCLLVTLHTLRADTEPLRLIFLAPLGASDEPFVRDILWWLAADAWAMARSGGVLGVWAAEYGYAPEESATIALFELHARQAAALATFLGTENYERLLALHTSQLGATSGQADSSSVTRPSATRGFASIVTHRE